jgi:hypothetical protein
MERGTAVAVVIKPKHERIKTMPARLCVAPGLFLGFILVLGAAPALAANEKQPAQGGLFQGTPEEQAACAPDSTRFCQDAIPDTFRVLACLQDHREKLRKVCRKVLEDHGQ